MPYKDFELIKQLSENPDNFMNEWIITRERIVRDSQDTICYCNRKIKNVNIIKNILNNNMASAGDSCIKNFKKDCKSKYKSKYAQLFKTRGEYIELTSENLNKMTKMLDKLIEISEIEDIPECILKTLEDKYLKDNYNNFMEKCHQVIKYYNNKIKPIQNRNNKLKMELI